MKKISLETWMGILVLACMILLYSKGLNGEIQTSGAVQKETILIDPGHGGSDPGKIGVNNAKEKEINLAIAKKLKACLEEQGYQIVMTREDDNGLYAEEGRGSKSEDMRNRCALIEKTAPVMTVSIHQNSYTSESISGPQVFYFATSKEGQSIAECIQSTMNEKLGIERPREIKGNDTYYLLKRSASPAVIVECGFLSNYAEAEKLITETYQTQVAEAICQGILKYMTEEYTGGKNTI